MGKGRRMSSGGNRGSNQRILKQRVDSCRSRFSDDPEDIVNHLRKEYPMYSRLKQKALSGQVKQILHQSPARKTVDDYEEVENSTREITRRKRRRSEEDESERRLAQIEDEYAARRIKRNHSSSDSESDSASESGTDTENRCSSAVSTSSMEDDDAIFGEKVEPKFDLMQTMLRESYRSSGADGRGGQSTPRKDKIIEMEEVGNEKTKAATVKVGLPNSNKTSNKHSNELSRKDSKMIPKSGVELERKEKTDDCKITFNDLGGMQEVLKELTKMVLFPLYNPELAARAGVKPTSGILLHGPSGCGKTTLAHAIANEAKMPLYKIVATEIVSGVSGASEENIRALFNKAYRTAPSVVFVDEIDVIASKREDAQKEMDRRIVTQLMTCMDEFHKPTQPVDEKTESESPVQRPGYVLVIGATNRPDAIDPALRRPGRFDREIKLSVPDEAARMEILQLLTKRCTLEGSLDLLQIARATPGFVGADLDELVNQAGKLAMLRVIDERESKLSEQTEKWWEVPCLPEEIEKFAVTMADFEEAAKMVNPSTRREGFSTVPNVKWDDIGGLESIREVFDLEVVGRIKDPDTYKEVGIDEATGILLYGPPGCGKTLIAKAAANEAGANFIHVKGPELLNKYVGESEQAIRALFSRARTCSPCIIFFDEVDALGTQRGREGGWVVERLVNQFLTELDGAADRKDVFVVGATNRPDIMDPALLRPGRFGRHLYVPLPSPEERGLILRVLAKRKAIDPEVDLSVMGQMKACENFTGADLAQLMKHAGLEALAEARKTKHSKDTPTTIKMSHFERVLAKMVPSVSEKQLQFFASWSDRFKKAA